MAELDPSVAAWRVYCLSIAYPGEMVFASGAPDDPDVRAEGIRALSRYMAFGLEQSLRRGRLLGLSAIEPLG